MQTLVHVLYQEVTSYKWILSLHTYYHKGRVLFIVWVVWVLTRWLTWSQTRLTAGRRQWRRPRRACVLCEQGLLDRVRPLRGHSHPKVLHRMLSLFRQACSGCCLMHEKLLTLRLFVVAGCCCLWWCRGWTHAGAEVSVCFRWRCRQNSTKQTACL